MVVCRLTDEELIEDIESVQEDLNFLNAQIRSMEDTLNTLYRRRDKSGADFHRLMGEAKTRKLLVEAKNEE